MSRIADGTDLNALWDELAGPGGVFDIWNKERNGIADLLSFKVTVAGDAVPQAISSPSFSESTEFGVGLSAATPAEALLLGYKRRDHDLRVATSARFLRDCDHRQFEAIVSSVLNADNKLTTGKVLRRLFSPAQEHNEAGWVCYGLYVGNDGVTPPPHLGQTFPSTTNHYLTSGVDGVIDSQDVEDMIKLARGKGFGVTAGSQLLLLVNPDQAEQVSTWRAGKESRTSGPLAKWDFISAQTAPPYLTSETIVGQPVKGDYHGIPVLGSYGWVWVIESPFVPTGYAAVVASGRPNSPDNVIGFREHPSAEQRGLLTIAGLGSYPVIDSHFCRCFGVGTRQRGGAAVCQMTASSTYTPPVIPV